MKTDEDPSQVKQSGHLDFYKSLVTTAPYEPGDASPLVPIEEIPWVDKSLIKHGLYFYCKHASSSLFASLLLFLNLMSIKPITSVALKGKMGDPAQHFPKYLLSIRSLLTFLQSLWDPAKAHKTYDNVRKQHRLAANRSKRPSSKPLRPNKSQTFSEKWKEEISQAFHADLSHIDASSAPIELLTWMPPVAASQLDMALSQFAFIWIFLEFSNLFGIRNNSEELKGVIHLWAIYGRLLGIKDEYNICIKPGYELYDLLARNFFIASWKNMDETVITYQSTFMNAIQARVPFITYKGILYTGLREMQNGEGENNLWKIMSFGDKVSYRFIQAWMWLARQNFILRLPLDILAGLWLTYHLRVIIFERSTRYLVSSTATLRGKISSLINPLANQPK